MHDYRELVLGNAGDGASGASVLASAAGNAGILVGNGGDVVDLKDASRASVGADAASDALVGLDDRMSHGKTSSVAPDATGERAAGLYGN